VFILQHYLVSKPFAAFREAVSSAYPRKEVTNKAALLTSAVNWAAI
jgi:hypothetical protein